MTTYFIKVKRINELPPLFYLIYFELGLWVTSIFIYFHSWVLGFWGLGVL